MQSILVYDTSAEELERLAEENGTTVPEILEEIIDTYKENM